MSCPIPEDKRIDPYIERLPWSGCWIWLKSLNNSGYGTVSIKGKSAFAHRFSWEFYRGKIPSGKYVLHKCDIPSCVNPDHLFIGSQRENHIDSQEKGRRYKQPPDKCMHGHTAIAENVYFSNGHRYCLLCKRASRKKAKALS